MYERVVLEVVSQMLRIFGVPMSNFSRSFYKATIIKVDIMFDEAI